MEVGGRGESREEGAENGRWPRPEPRCPQRWSPDATAFAGYPVEAEVGSAELPGGGGKLAARGRVGVGWVERKWRRRRRTKRRRKRCGPRSGQVPQ